MKQRYLVTYDICDPKRLREVLMIMKGAGTHLQFSVFRCDLSATRLAELKMALRPVINQDSDQVLFINLGPSEGRGREVIQSLGVPYVDPDEGPFIF